MTRLCVLILAIVVGIFVVPVSAQEPEEYLKDLENELNEIYAEMHELQLYLQENLSEEIEQKLEVLAEKAQIIESQIHEITKKYLEPFLEKREWEDKPPAEEWGERRPDKKPPKHDEKIEKLRNEIREKRQQLEKIDQEILDADEGQWKKLEKTRVQVMRELEKLEKKFQKMEEEVKREGDKGKKVKDEEAIRAKVEEQLEILKQEDPELYQRLIELREKNPKKFRHHIEEAMRERQKLEELKQQDPELYNRVVEERKLERRVDNLVAAIRRAKGKEQEPLKTELRDILNRLFDLREQARLREIEEVKKRVHEMEQQIQARRANKAIIVEQRMQEILGEEGGWEW